MKDAFSELGVFLWLLCIKMFTLGSGLIEYNKWKDSKERM